MHSRPLIGLVVNDLVGTYQHTFWSGMIAAAAQEDCDLVSFNGGELGSRHHDKAMRRSAFDLIGGAKPDALVLMAPALMNSGDQTRLDAFLKKLGNTPRVTVGFTLPGHPAVLLDNSSGMAAVVEHLVHQHGRRRFAFLGGPNFNSDARERRENFLSVLERAGLPFEPILEATASWDFAMAKEQVLALCDTGVPFDALVAANDDMALAAIEALRERGRRVPDDVVVTGFDNAEEGIWSNPGLTSVHQPVFEQGEACVRLALEHLEGSAAGRTRTMRTRIVTRGSCGCRSATLIEAGRTNHLPTSRQEGFPGCPAHIAAVREACEEMIGGNRMTEPLIHLVEGLVAGAVADDDVPAVEAFGLLMELAPKREPMGNWQDFLSRTRAASIPFFGSDPAALLRLDGILHELRILAEERSLRTMAQRALHFQRWAREVHETGLRLLASTDMDSLADILTEQVRTLRISSLHLLLADRKVRSKDCTLVLAIRNGVRCTGGVHERAPLRETVQGILRGSALRSAMVVEPLFFGDEHLGYLVLEPGSRLGVLLDSLRGQVSAALHSHLHGIGR